jgi:hypothetical protein
MQHENDGSHIRADSMLLASVRVARSKKPSSDGGVDADDIRPFPAL